MMRNFKQWFVRYRLHMLVWGIYMFYEYVIEALLFGNYGTLGGYLTHYALIITLFYVHAKVLLPQAFKDKYLAALKLPFFIAIELAAYLTICFANDQALIKWHLIMVPGPLKISWSWSLRNLYRGVYFVGFSTGYYFLITYNKERRMREEIERQRLNEIIARQVAEQELTKAHNAFLKAQINPHFLFNTLDFIYHNILELSPVAAEAIIMLADMMRFAIDADKMGEFISLGDEIDQVMNLYHLNQVRKSEEAAFELSYPEEARDILFIPLVLLTLTENIFKHGLLTNEWPARLRINLDGGMLTIESDNMANRAGERLTGGSGLANIGKRLNYAYGEAAIFRHGTDKDGRFKVTISVPLQLQDGSDGFLIASANTGK